MARHWRRLRHWALCLPFFAAAGCGKSVDSLGYDEHAGKPLRALRGPTSYPNAFRDVLGKSDADISAKLDDTYRQLFHGDPGTEAIYFPMGDDQAYVQDTLHDDIRTEGLGLGMMFLVQLDHQGEFDRLWTYAKENLRVDSGPNAGYFNSSCDTPDGDTVPCLDPFGLEQFVTALLFARTRWEDTPSGIDYEQEAAALFDLMQHKQDQNGGIVDGVTNTFDFHAHLPYDLPNLASKNYTRPAVAIPAYYELWAQATSDPFWKHAAEAARGYLDRAAHPATGLLPVRAYFDGEPVTDWNVFEPEGYRAELNIALDQIWFGDPRDMDESNKLLLFFSTAGIDAYGASYPLEGGACIKCDREPALIAANGAIAIAASPNLRGRADFIQAVWDSKLLTGTPRYYGGLMQLGALLVLSGQFRVY